MEIIALLIGVVLGGITVWFIAKLKFQQSKVSSSEVEKLSTDVNTFSSALKVENEKVSSLRENLSSVEKTLDLKSDEINQLTAKLSSKATTCEVLEKQMGEMKLEAETLKQSVENKRDEIENLVKKSSATEARLDSANQTLKSSEEIISTSSKEIKAKTDEITLLNKQVAELSAKKNFLEDKLATQQSEIESIRKQFEAEFKNLANQILEDKSQKFTELNKTNLDNILKPLGEKIEIFKKKVEEVYENESKERFSLGKEVEKLVQLNQKISEEANNLTRALEGSSKTQGDWGEMILESILERSGLVKDREYLVQQYLRDADGNILKNEDGIKMQPDIVILYPDNRKVIVDSKVSLVAYKRFAAANDQQEQSIALAKHIESIRKHVDDLSKKNYQDFTASLDFVMMFVPIEPAYLIAIHQDQELWSYAYNKRVLLISPTNLIAALKLIADLWKREFQNRNAIEIAERGGQLYDKFVGFVESLSDVGENIGRAQKSYDKAFGQLKDGGGNLITQAHKLKELGAKAKKALPSTLVTDANAIDEKSSGLTRQFTSGDVSQEE
ncbi:MAG: DNA recombination protein RmuC [Ignavibacteriales bacterium]|nr:DNA recombination protein RmuC [Ignavibacteriales bacterium]